MTKIGRALEKREAAMRYRGKFARQSQLYDDATVKPCRHTMHCELHGRCISVGVKLPCPYRCQVCRREHQHA